MTSAGWGRRVGHAAYNRRECREVNSVAGCGYGAAADEDIDEDIRGPGAA